MKCAHRSGVRSTGAGSSEWWERLCYASEHRNYDLNKHQLTPQAVHAGWRWVPRRTHKGRIPSTCCKPKTGQSRSMKNCGT